METGPVIVDLRKVEMELREKVNSLQAELSSTEAELSYVRRLIHQNTQDRPSLEPQRIPEQVQGLRPTEALREAFNEAPHKRWSPVELKERLERLRSENRLSSASKRLFGATHTAIAALMHAGFIQKHTDGKAPTYSKKEPRQKSE